MHVVVAVGPTFWWQLAKQILVQKYAAVWCFDFTNYSNYTRYMTYRTVLCEIKTPYSVQ